MTPRGGMPLADLHRPSVIKALLKKYGLRPNKALGQNFIADSNHLDRILSAAELSLSDAVLEIGPGIGALTQELAARCRGVTAIEIDRGLVSVLAETCGGFANVRIIHADILKVDLGEILSDLHGGPREGATQTPVKVVANLPYYITTPVIFRLLELRTALSGIVLLVQREVAERLVAAPDSPEYGALTVVTSYACSTSIVGFVPPAAFYPQPEVTSAIILMRPVPPSLSGEAEAVFHKVVRLSFGQRRKTLRNSLEGVADKSTVELALESARIDAKRRGETLSADEFCRLALAFWNLQNT